jgi:hypothetical protein
MRCLDDATVDQLVRGTLPPPLQRRAEEHLSACRECRQLVSQLARLQVPTEAHGPTLVSPPPRRPPRLAWALALSLVAGALVAAALVVTSRPHPLPRAPSPAAARAEALLRAGIEAARRGAFDDARVRFEEARALAQRSDDGLHLAAATESLSVLARAR